MVRAIRRQTSGLAQTCRFHDVPNWDGETLEDDLERELKCVKDAGVRQVVVVDLTKPEFGLPVVRVIVPGLESILVPGYVPGRRGRVMLEKQP